jgi:hypothetical protein
MRDKLITYLRYGNRFFGVEQTQQNGEDIFFGLVLKKKRKQIDVETSFKAKNFNDLKSLVPKGKAINLVINTNAVLTKCVKSNNEDIKKLVFLAFPNIKVDDFYYESLNQGENSFVSICRKSYIDDLLKVYDSKGIPIIDFSLGNLISSTLVPHVDFDEIESSNTIISIKDKSIIGLIASKQEQNLSFNVNGLDIKNIELLSCASALNQIINGNRIQSSFEDVKQELTTEFNQKQFFNQFIKLGLSFLFVVLLINFLVFNHYYNEVNTLRETAQVLETSKTKMISLSEKVQKTEKMVSDVLKSSSSKSSFYINDIINHLPEHIILKEFNYQPLLKRIKEDKAIENQKNTIRVSGEIHERVLFSQWISLLEEKLWVGSIQILSFEDINNSSSSFKIKLIIDVSKN